MGRPGREKWEDDGGREVEKKVGRIRKERKGILGLRG